MKYVSHAKVMFFLLTLLPLAGLVYGAFTESLGANQIEYITRDLGTWGLTFLLCSARSLLRFWCVFVEGICE